jgi:CubicO group peptidase (beta-lactamase class C family)
VTAVLLALAAERTVAQTPAGFDTTWSRIAAHFNQRMDEEGIVGGSFWFVHDGQVLGKEVHGFADLETQRRVAENTIYHWASITKTFTGIAIMQLRDRGLLTMDDPVIHYLPELRQVHNPFGPIEAITIRQLLSHSAGFRNPTWPWGGDEPWHPHEPTEWSQLVAMMPYTEILFPPGSKYSYSNPGIIFLGRIIEQLTGDDYEVYMDKNVLSPFGMHHSYFDATPYHLLAYRSNNYSVKDGDTIANGLDFDTGITTSNGGLNGPVPDMVRYLSFLTGACGDPACAKVLARSSLEEMWRPVVPLEPDTVSRTTPPSDWTASLGFTFFLYDRSGVRYIGHTGGQKSFVTFIYFDPQSQAAAVGAFNTVGDPKPDAGALLRELRERLFDDVFPLFRQGGRR